MDRTTDIIKHSGNFGMQISPEKSETIAF